MPERLKRVLPLGAVLALALALRLWGLAFGLPLVSNLYVRPDESLIVAPAARFFETAGYPGSLDYPTLLMAVCSALFQAYFGLAHALGWTQAPDMLADFIRQSSPYWLIARGVSAVAGTLTTLLVFLIARRLFAPGAALLAALFYATAPLAVRDAHFATTDNLLTLLLAAALYAAVRFLETEQGSLWPAALLLGLAASTKYAAWLLLPALMAAALLKTPRRIPWRLCLLLAVPAAVFALVNPYTAARWHDFTALMSRILRIFYLHQPGDAPWTVAGAFGQIWMPLRYGPGAVPGLVFCAVGLVWPLKAPGSRSKKCVLALAGLSFLLAIFLFRHAVPYRYVLPALPAVAVFAGQGALLVAGLTRRAWLPVLLGVAVAAPGAWKSVSMDRLLTRADTRTLAGRWIEDHVAADVPIVLLGGPECEPQVPETAASIERRMRYVERLYGNAAGEVISIPYRLQLRGLETGKPRGYEVFRNPAAPPPGRTVLVVTPHYPLGMTKFSPGALQAYSGRTLRSVEITSLSGDWEDFELDRIDAFFLPWSGLESATRPGPNIRLWLVTPEPRP